VIKSTVPGLLVERPSEAPKRHQIGTREEFEIKKRENDLIGVDIKNVDLRELDLSGLFLHDVRMTSCDLRGANLKKTWIVGSSLVDVDFSNADLSSARLRDCEGLDVMMNKATLDEAEFERCTFIDCTLDHASMRDMKLRDCTLRRCSAERADLSGACIGEGTFEHVIFDRAYAKASVITLRTDFINVSWRSTCLSLRSTRSTFERADFTHADLQDSSFIYCPFHGPVELERCRGFTYLVRCELDNVNLLQLQAMPYLIPAGLLEAKENKRHDALRDAWARVVNWRKADTALFELGIDLEYYKANISWFDAEMRRCLRDKVLTLAQSMPALQTEKSCAQLREIIALDDALGGQENSGNRMGSSQPTLSCSPVEFPLPEDRGSNEVSQDGDVNSFWLIP